MQRVLIAAAMNLMMLTSPLYRQQQQQQARTALTTTVAATPPAKKRQRQPKKTQGPGQHQQDWKQKCGGGSTHVEVSILRDGLLAFENRTGQGVEAHRGGH